MADTSSTTTIINNSSNHTYATENSTIKKKLTPEQYSQLIDNLLEIKQIKYQEQLVHEKINHLNTQKQHLQNLLNLLHVMDANDRIKTSQSHQRRLKKINSKSRLN